jgi:hypothetical protein
MYPNAPPANVVLVFNESFDPLFMTQAIQVISLTGGSIPWLTRVEPQLFPISASGVPVKIAYQTIPLIRGPAFGWCPVTQGGVLHIPFPPPRGE